MGCVPALALNKPFSMSQLQNQKACSSLILVQQALCTVPKCVSIMDRWTSYYAFQASGFRSSSGLRAYGNHEWVNLLQGTSPSYLSSSLTYAYTPKRLPLVISLNQFGDIIFCIVCALIFFSLFFIFCSNQDVNKVHTLQAIG